MKNRLFLLALLTTLPLCANPYAQSVADGATPTPAGDANSLFDIPISIDPLAAALGLVSIALTIWGLMKSAEAAAYRREAIEEKQRADSAGAKAQALWKRLFYKAGLVKWEVTVTDLDGSLVATCTWEDIEIIPQGETLSNLVGEIWFPPLDSKIEKYPELLRRSFKGESVITREVILTPDETYAYGSTFNLKIKNSLPSTHTFSYTYETIVSKGLYMSLEDVEEKGSKNFQKEFWAHTVVTPVDKIIISVQFPKEYRPREFYVGICVGDDPSDDAMRGDELQRMTVEKKIEFDPGQYWAKLTVEEPYVGFTYLLYWIPPTRREIDALRPPAVSSDPEKGGAD